MLMGLRFIDNWIVEVSSITFGHMSNGSSVPCFTYKTLDHP
jgi:hypothetical protein